MGDCKSMIMLDPANAAHYYTRGTVYEKMGMLSESVNDYTQCLSLDPNHCNAAYALGACENKRGNFDKAIENYQLAFEKDVRSSTSARRLTNDQVNYLLEQKEQPKQPEPKVINIQRTNSNKSLLKPKPQKGIVILHGPHKDINKELDLSPFHKLQAKITSMEPRMPTPLSNSHHRESTGLLAPPDSILYRGNLSESKQGEDSKLLISSSSNSSHSSTKTDNPFQISEISIKVTESQLTESEHLQALGKAAKKRGDYKEAIDYYSKAILLDPNSSKPLFSRAFLYDKIGNLSSAISDYGQVISLEPENAFAYYNRGIALDKTNKYEDAINHFTKAISLLPNNPDFYHNRGFAYRATKKYNEAIKDYTQAIQLDQKHFRVNIPLFNSFSLGLL